MEFFQGLWLEITSGDYPWVTFLFVVNVVLLVFARPLVNLAAPGQDNDARVRILRGLNLLLILLHIVDFAVRETVDGYEGYVIKLGSSLMVIYGGVFLHSLAGTLSRRRFGRTREVDDERIFVETYNSRLVGIVLLSVIVITTIYVLIKVWGADSLLETTGIFGIFIAFLAFTSSIWATDIFSGLIILNSDILADGDVVVIEGQPDEYIIARVTLIYVVLYDVRNNHRTLMRNSEFIDSRIDNLSRIASSDGVRKSYTYKIGYPDMSEAITLEERKAALDAYRGRIDAMFKAANTYCVEHVDILINPNAEFEWALTSAGDFALEYTLWFYLDRIPNTKITATIRRHFMGTLYRVNEAVFAASVEHGVDLSTPDIVQFKGADPATEPAPILSA